MAQLGSTLVPLIIVLAAMHIGFALGWWWLVPALMLPAAGLTVRTFIIQHDCGHGSFLSSRRANDALGRFCSLFTFAPYAHWRRQHAQHHGTWNDLDRREGRGTDIYSACLTVAEYEALSPSRRRWHRLLNHPIVALLLLPPFIFLVLYRLPFDTPPSWLHERRSVHLTNLSLLTCYAGLGLVLGFPGTLLVLLAVMVPASTAGVWIFSVQHRFEGARWARHDDWNPVTAAIEGCSFLHLSRPLQWLTGSIGFHHVHHLAPRVPNYRLEECHRAHPAFASAHVLTLWEGLRGPRQVLWDEDKERMVTFAELRSTPRKGWVCRPRQQRLPLRGVRVPARALIRSVEAVRRMMKLSLFRGHPEA
ncbi:fatty acid desaturase [Roseomonas sp. HJA6]|uniref:Fatty acid desaturase n=1 Tax=Roseomonas alba TaxID=2846776 RepID=A0ABS7AGE4_9PROT|nr:fatty acid desaturase [Neoroseomonas alba]MBW6401388.1 fatty acid desaturase [Neoroseomonas alba]